MNHIRSSTTGIIIVAVAPALIAVSALGAIYFRMRGELTKFAPQTVPVPLDEYLSIGICGRDLGTAHELDTEGFDQLMAFLQAQTSPSTELANIMAWLSTLE